MLKTTQKKFNDLIADIEKNSTDALALTLFLTAYDLTFEYPQTVHQGLVHHQKAYAVANLLIDYLQDLDFKPVLVREALKHCFNELFNQGKVRVDFLVNHI